MRKHERSLIRILQDKLAFTQCRWNTMLVEFGAEVGVWKGELSAQLLRHFPNLRLAMIDSWAETEGRSTMHDKDNNEKAMSAAMLKALANTEFAKNRRIVFQMESVSAARLSSDKRFHFVFIDADHYYESVLADVKAWWPKVMPGGVLAGHDYNGLGDRRERWGVKRAVDEFFGELELQVNVEPGLVWWVSKTQQ